MIVKSAIPLYVSAEPRAALPLYVDATPREPLPLYVEAGYVAPAAPTVTLAATFSIGVTATVNVSKLTTEALAATLSVGLTISTTLSVEGTAPLWTAGMEAGTLSQWSASGGGGVFDSGDATTIEAYNEQAHTGSWSIKQVTSTATRESGARIFRWGEFAAEEPRYSSAWLYLTSAPTPTNYWNVYQFKSKETPSSAGSDPFIVVNIGKRGNGNLYLYVYLNQVFQGYGQTVADLPVGQWVHLESYLVQSRGNTGRFMMWQDGVLILDLTNLKTLHSNLQSKQHWSLDNYSDGLTPSAATLYWDDAIVSAGRITPQHPPLNETTLPPPDALPTNTNFDDWTKTRLTLASDGTFSNGNPRFLATAAGATGTHTMGKTYALAAGLQRTLSFLVQANTAETFTVNVNTAGGDFIDYVFAQANSNYTESGGVVAVSFSSVSGSLRRLNIVVTNPAASTGLRFDFLLWGANGSTDSYTVGSPAESIYLGGPTLT